VGIVVGKTALGAGFIKLFLFRPQILIPLTAPYSLIIVTQYSLDTSSVDKNNKRKEKEES
jgi:hypothetical protein